jgi:hypothetical protein
MLVVNHCGVRR